MSPILLMTPDSSVEFTATVVIAGVSIVVGVLLLLIFVFYIFGALVSKLEAGSKKKKAQKVAQKVVIPAPPKPVITAKPAPAMQVEQGISGEVVAAIAAAVAACEGPDATVRAIRKKNVSGRNPWAYAAVADNTRPF